MQFRKAPGQTDVGAVREALQLFLRRIGHKIPRMKPSPALDDIKCNAVDPTPHPPVKSGVRDDECMGG